MAAHFNEVNFRISTDLESKQCPLVLVRFFYYVRFRSHNEAHCSCTLQSWIGSLDRVLWVILIDSSDKGLSVIALGSLVDSEVGSTFDIADSRMVVAGSLHHQP